MRILSALREPWYRHQPIQVFKRTIRQAKHKRGIVTVRLAWGVPLRINVDELIGATIWHRGVHDLAASEATFRILKPGDVAVDVGANIGYMTSLMVARVGKNGRVHAFEPHPLLFEALQTNVALFVEHQPGSEVALYNTALGACRGKGNLNLPAAWEANHGLATLSAVATSTEAILVNVERLDDVVKEKTVKLLKLDVEGQEAGVLNGGTDLLSSGRIRNIIYEDHNPSESPIRTILKQHGYSVFTLGFSNAGFKSELTEWESGEKYPSSDFLATLDPVVWRMSAAGRGWSIFSKK